MGIADIRTTVVVERVIVRVSKAALAWAMGEALAHPSRTWCAGGRALRVGSTVVLALHRFDRSGAMLGCSNPPRITLRRSQRWLPPASATCLSVRTAGTSDGRDWLELLVMPRASGSPELWGIYWPGHGHPRPDLVVKTTPDSRVVLPRESTSRLDDPIGPVLPRTAPTLQGDDATRAWLSLHVAIAGAGRSGSMIAECLASQWVRRITLIDDDILELGNLDGMSLVSQRSVGKTKVEAVGRGLVERFPELAVTAVPEGFPSPRSIAAAASADVLVTAIDRARPRLEAASLARSLLQLHLDVGTGGPGFGPAGSDVRILLPQGRCILCLGGAAEEGRRGARIPGNSGRFINGVAAHVGVQLVLDAVAGNRRDSAWIQIATGGRDTPLQTQDIPARRVGGTCPWCGTSSS